MASFRGHCFTTKYNGLSNALQNDVQVSSVVPGGQVLTNKARALWDTGAMSSAITPALANKLGLKVVSRTIMTTPSGTADCNQYFITLLLPNKVEITDVLVLEAIPANCDILIGMDIIGMGDFAVSHFEGKTMFSFRIPSMQHFDFTEHSYFQPLVNEQKQKRNDDCACGSGKKYKNCCGKTS
jgi:hypothetical protein